MGRATELGKKVKGVIDPDRKLPRGPDGFLLSIKTETDETRKIWLFPDPKQGHVCMIYGYCPIHKIVHEHPKRSKALRSKKLGKKVGESP